MNALERSCRCCENFARKASTYKPGHPTISWQHAAEFMETKATLSFGKKRECGNIAFVCSMEWTSHERGGKGLLVVSFTKHTNFFGSLLKTHSTHRKKESVLTSSVFRIPRCRIGCALPCAPHDPNKYRGSQSINRRRGAIFEFLCLANPNDWSFAKMTICTDYLYI